MKLPMNRSSAEGSSTGQSRGGSGSPASCVKHSDTSRDEGSEGGEKPDAILVTTPADLTGGDAAAAQGSVSWLHDLDKDIFDDLSGGIILKDKMVFKDD